MTCETLQVSADDDTRLATYRWRAEGTPRCILLIVHGMAEHARRYDAFARRLAAAGIDVHAYDMRGHGATTQAVDHGYMGATVDWQTLLDDTARIRTHALDAVGRLPVFLFGHSLGSFIVQGVLQQRGGGYAGAILSATDSPSRLLCRLGAMLATLEAARVDATGTSRLLHTLTLGAYERRLKHRLGAARPFAWLSSNTDAVSAYCDDPACGFPLRTETWRRLLHGIARINSPHARRAMPAGLPLLLVAGEHDPMGRFGRGPAALARALTNDGQHPVELRIYAAARHELLHDHVADTVAADIENWIDTRLRPNLSGVNSCE